MERHTDIEKRIEETLNSLDGMHRAEANPFLYTRIQARLMAKKSAFDKVISIAGKPVFALTILFVVLVSNVSVMVQSSLNESEQTTEQSNQLAVADEYSNNVPASYDYENPEP